MKILSEKYLNAKIQDSSHSSVIDARTSLAIFLKLRGSHALDVNGPTFLDEHKK